MTQRFFVYVYHHIGRDHEIRDFKTAKECEDFIFSVVGTDPELGFSEVRIFAGDELQWKPRDIVKSVRLMWPDEK